MATYAIEITAEDVKKAKTFTSIAAKEVLTRAVAHFCVEPVEINSEETGTLPPMFRENRKLRQQFQMGILANLLGREYPLQTVKIHGDDGAQEQGLAWCMDKDEYDKWAGSHVINQLERLKKGADKETANLVFDFLYDYKAIEMMVSGAIRDELEELNDPLNRVMRLLSMSALQSAMDTVVKSAVQEEQKKKEGEANG